MLIVGDIHIPVEIKITIALSLSLSLSLSRVLALKPVDFDLFARSSVSETVLGNCYLVCDSSIAPISFCFSSLYFEQLAILGADVDELAC